MNSLLGDPAQRNRAAADDGHEVWCPAAKMQGSDVRLQGVCLRVDRVVFVAPQVCFRISQGPAERLLTETLRDRNQVSCSGPTTQGKE